MSSEYICSKHNKNIKIKLPKWVKYIIDTLEEFEHEAYVVGGCIRDSLLQREIHDWDIATNAIPQDVVDIFTGLGYKVIETGIKHGTVTIVINKESFEVTTYRIDGEYKDGRHPDSVVFARNLKDDLLRRDFTINALAYNGEKGLIDYFNGLEDLKNKTIRCVGKAEDRFNEDNLRRLRAVRFACQLGFKIENSTLEALMINPQRLMLLSKERIRDELCKILLSNNPSWGIKELWCLDILKYIIPEFENCYGFNQFNPYHDKDIFEHILSVVENTPQKLELRLSALLHDIGKPQCFTFDVIGHFYGHAEISADISREILTRLRFDNKTIDTICKLVHNHMTPTALNDKFIKKLIQRVGEDNIYNLLELMIADRKGMAEDYQCYYDILDFKYKIDKILSEKQPLSVKDLDINGYDLMKLGYKGKELGDKLNELLDVVLENPELNHKEKLIELINNK